MTQGHGVRTQQAIALPTVAAALVGAATADMSTTTSAVAMCVAAWFLPVVVLAPQTWTGRISEQHYLREGLWFVPAVAVYVPVAAAVPAEGAPPVGAVVLMTAAAYLLIAGRVWRGIAVDKNWLVITVAACVAAGQLADLPVPLSWYTGASLVFGACAYVTMSVVIAAEAAT